MSSPATVSSASAPLTTIFTPPAGCLENIYVAQFNSTNFFGLATPCGVQNDSCLPPLPLAGDAVAAPVYSLQPSLYTPGLFCPSGYYTAATTQLAASVTGAACCPSGFAPNGIVCEALPVSTFTATGCDKLTTTFTATSGAPSITFSAALVVLAFESSDLSLASAAADSSGGTATIVQSSSFPTSNSTSNQATTSGSLPTIHISNTPFTASISQATTTSTSKTSGASQKWKSGNMLVLAGLAAAAIAALC